MHRLVFLMVGIGEEHTGSRSKVKFSVRLGIGDFRGVRRLVQAGKIGLAMSQSSEQGKAEQLVGPEVQADQRQGQQACRAWTRAAWHCAPGAGPWPPSFRHRPCHSLPACHRPPGFQRRRRRFRRQHAGLHGVVAALDARQVDEAGAQPISAPPGKTELGHRLRAAFGDGAGAIADALAALQHLARWPDGSWRAGIRRRDRARDCGN